MRFRRLPKGPGGQIDKKRIHEQYLAGPDYSWAEFCKRQGYNPSFRHDFPLRTWQAEWKQRRLRDQEDLLVPERVNFRSEVLRRRIDTLRVQVADNSRLRSVHSRTLAAVEEAGIPLSPKELLTLASAQRIIQRNEHDALLLTAAIHEEAVVDSPHYHSEEEMADALENERIKNAKVVVMGHEGVSEERLGEIVAKWFDQLNDSKEPLDGLSGLKEADSIDATWRQS